VLYKMGTIYAGLGETAASAASTTVAITAGQLVVTPAASPPPTPPNAAPRRQRDGLQPRRHAVQEHRADGPPGRTARDPRHGQVHARLQLRREDRDAR